MLSARDILSRIRRHSLNPNGIIKIIKNIKLETLTTDNYALRNIIFLYLHCVIYKLFIYFFCLHYSLPYSSKNSLFPSVSQDVDSARADLPEKRNFSILIRNICVPLLHFIFLLIARPLATFSIFYK